MGDCGALEPTPRDFDVATAAMMEQLATGDTLAKRRRGGALLFGRDVELAQLRDVLVDGGRLVAFVTGISGIGKSALASALAAEAANLGHAVHCLDGNRLEPTAR